MAFKIVVYSILSHNPMNVTIDLCPIKQKMWLGSSLQKCLNKLGISIKLNLLTESIMRWECARYMVIKLQNEIQKNQTVCNKVGFNYAEIHDQKVLFLSFICFLIAGSSEVTKHWVCPIVNWWPYVLGQKVTNIRFSPHPKEFRHK